METITNMHTVTERQSQREIERVFDWLREKKNETKWQNNGEIVTSHSEEWMRWLIEWKKWKKNETVAL